ncbi:MAG: YceI family protein [Tannerella sp.]|jgi:polyisoprenoid-binding protein YceI|nr:YceI family protein [Tannerella sp.]
MKKFRITGVATLFITAAVFFAAPMSAQTLTFNAQKSSILIKGDSNLHDWELKASEVHGEAVVDATAKELKSLTVDLPVTALKSDEGSMMDNQTYKVLKSDKNPKIVFKMTSVTSFSIGADKTINATVAGTLSVAGTSGPVTVTATGKSSGANSYVFTGTVPMKLTSLGIKPPTVLLGTLKVKDEISMEFSVVVDGISSSAL